MKFLVLNSSNYVTGSNNQFQYNFPSGVKFQEGDQIAVSSVEMFNSIFNIEAKRNNNTLQIILNYATPVTLTITFSDGFYAISDIQSFIQSVCYANGYYMTTTNGSIIYPIEIAPNLINYSIQWVCNVIPTSAQATSLSYSKPSGVSWNFPSSSQCCQVVILNNGFQQIVGSNAGTYPNSIQSTVYTFQSTNVATLNPVSTLIMRCNFICNSAYSYPSDILNAIPITTSFASVISQTASNLIFQDIQPNTYQQMIIGFYDQLFNPVVLHDFTVTIVLVIKTADEK